MEERGEPALEGRVVASPDDDGTGRARLEIQLMNAQGEISRATGE